MPAATQDQELSIPFAEAGFDGLAGVQFGEIAGPAAAVLGTFDLADFRDAMADIRQRADAAAKKVTVTANWTERSCQQPGAAALGKPQADKGCTVILSGSRPGSGTVLPPSSSVPGSATVPGAVPESPPEQDAGSDTYLLYYPRHEVVTSHFHEVERDGLLVLPGKGVYAARTLLEAGVAGGEGRTEEQPSDRVAPVLDLGEGVAIPVGAAGTCRTFGANPQVLVLPPARFHVSVAVSVKTVDLAIALTVEVTPVRASFGRTGRCWEGICDSEVITGSVVSTVSVKLSLRATGAIKIGRWKIGGANIVFQTDASVPRVTSYTLRPA